MHAGGRQPLDPGGVGQRREKRDQHLPAAQPRSLLGGRRRDLRDDVGAPRIADRRAGLAVRLVREPCGFAGARLDDHLDAVPEPADGLGNQRDPTFAGNQLLRDSELHPTATLSHPAATAVRSRHGSTPPTLLARVTQLLLDYGLVLLFVFVAVESAGVPIPGETALITAARARATRNITTTRSSR